VAPWPAGTRPAHAGAAGAGPAHSEQPNRDDRRLRGSPSPRGGSPSGGSRAGGSPTGTRVGPGHGGLGARPAGWDRARAARPASPAGRGGAGTGSLAAGAHEKGEEALHLAERAFVRSAEGATRPHTASPTRTLVRLTMAGSGDRRICDHFIDLGWPGSGGPTSRRPGAGGHRSGFARDLP
jgi:hypothetical protein